MDAIPGIASLDGTTVPFPVSTSELEAPAVMPEGINLLLLAPTKNKCQLLLDLTMDTGTGRTRLNHACAETRTHPSDKGEL